jgi:hypothetical protein
MTEQYPIKIVEENGVEYIFDHIRKKYVTLTPEEWVRQELIKFLIEKCNYPKGAISVEKRIKVNERFFRYDIVIYLNAEPWMLIECKSPEVAINMDSFTQSLIYQNKLQAQYILLCNGEKMVCLDIATQKWLQDMVAYPKIE